MWDVVAEAGCEGASNRRVNCDREQERGGGGWKEGYIMAKDTFSGGLGWRAPASTEPGQAGIQWVRRIWAMSADTVRTSPRDFLSDALTTSSDLWNICYVR